jgi:hypothetical protein
MPLEMALGALGKKTFASTLTASGERSPAGLRFHPGAKTVLLFTCALRSL